VTKTVIGLPEIRRFGCNPAQSRAMAFARISRYPPIPSARSDGTSSQVALARDVLKIEARSRHVQVDHLLPVRSSRLQGVVRAWRDLPQLLALRPSVDGLGAAAGARDRRSPSRGRTPRAGHRLVAARRSLAASSVA